MYLLYKKFQFKPKKQCKMSKRYMSIWFCYLSTDWQVLRRPELKGLPFVFAFPVKGRLLVISLNAEAKNLGICSGMAVADAKAMVPDLKVLDDKPGRAAKLLQGLGEWCIRYAPLVALDSPDGLIMDVSGCTHLWGGEHAYLNEIKNRLQSKGYQVSVAIADTIGAAWAVARYGKGNHVIRTGEQTDALLTLPAASLRLETVVLDRLQKLGLCQVGSFISMPRSNLRRRFGESLLLRIQQATGQEEEQIIPICLPATYQERLPCMEPIRTAIGIKIAIQKLLEGLCKQLGAQGLGIRSGLLQCFRLDGQVERVEVGTNRASHNISHLFKLFEIKISQIRPALGIELFVMEALRVEEMDLVQEKLWSAKPGMDDAGVAELLDRLAGKVGTATIHRYLPQAHYWPEQSIKLANSILEKPDLLWKTDRPRPTQLLSRPERVEVTAPIPDYPPMLFIYKGKVHQVKKADGPERIEREWWIDKGTHRDYYNVEDQDGQRYWLFRSGHYNGEKPQQWFIHGFFA
jgi:protein ImuB